MVAILTKNTINESLADSPNGSHNDSENDSRNRRDSPADSPRDFLTKFSKNLADDAATASETSLSLFGRTLLANGVETPCQTISLSCQTITVHSISKPAKHESVIFYIDEIGRLVGSVSSATNNSFCADIVATERKKNKLAAQIKWLALKQQQKVSDNRSAKRIVPSQPHWQMKVDNKYINVEIADISLSGAFVKCRNILKLGSQIQLGGIFGRIVRVERSGVALEFITNFHQPPYHQTHLSALH